MPNTDTLAANHGQNRSRGRAVRSDSSMISMPVVSTPSRRVCSSPDEGVVVLLMTESSRTGGPAASTGSGRHCPVATYSWSPQRLAVPDLDASC